jgi:hypothetical protein
MGEEEDIKAIEGSGSTSSALLLPVEARDSYNEIQMANRSLLPLQLSSSSSSFLFFFPSLHIHPPA